MDWLTVTRWSPYVVGAGIGVLSWLTFLLSDRAIGCSTAFSRVAGMIERALRGERALERPYYRRVTPVFGWEIALVGGMVVGAFLSAQLAGRFELRWTPALWAATFGPAPFPRVIAAAIGGMLLGLGARWADGCTSGHGISGTLQLAVSSWVAAVCFFAGGIATAALLYRVLGG